MSVFYPRGYFPFCVPLAEEWDGVTYYKEEDGLGRIYGQPSNSATTPTIVYGEGTEYPCGLSLEEAMELYWRVSVLKVTANVTLNPQDEEGDPLSWAFTVPAIRTGFQLDTYGTEGGNFNDVYITDSINYHEHRALVCEKSMAGLLIISGDSDEYSASDPSTIEGEGEFYDASELMGIASVSKSYFGADDTFSISMFGSAGILVSTSFGVVKGEDGLYYPHIGLYGNLESDNIMFDSTKFFFEEDGNVYRNDELTTVTLEIGDGYTFPIYLWPESEVAVGGFDIGRLAFSNLKITPHKWFSWDGTYNESTGDPV